MPYGKSNKSIQDSAFKLRSNNTTPFKQMGASPVKQNKPGGSVGEAIDHFNKYKLTKQRGYTGKFSYSNFKKMQKFREATKSYEKIRDAMFHSGKPPSAETTAAWNKAKRPNHPFSKAKTKLSTPKPSITSKVLNTLGKVGKVLTPVAVAEFLYSGYTSGQKHSGGRYGFEQNPSYDASKTGVKHGDASSNAMFIPTKGRAYKDMFSISKPKIINPK